MRTTATRRHLSTSVTAMAIALALAVLFLVGGPGQPSSGQAPANVAGTGTLSGGVYTINIDVSNLPAATTVGSYAVLVPFNGSNVSFVSASGGALAVPASDGSDQINIAQIALNTGERHAHDADVQRPQRHRREPGILAGWYRVEGASSRQH
jgi:hypothetical protein